jgi:hypothetical protein
MSKLTQAAYDFLSQQRIAVVGVSRTEQDAANGIYKKLRDSGYKVFAVNPNTNEVEGDTCYPNLQSIPNGVDAAVIVTTPQITEKVVRDCKAAKVKHVWIHQGMGNSVSKDAVIYCRENGINVIPGACPMMFLEPVDIAHRCFRTVFGWMGKLPEPV